MTNGWMRAAALAVAMTAAPVMAQEAVDDVAPVVPTGMAASFVPPARGADGVYATPNRDLTPDEIVWHVRVALNVAALGCRGADETATVAAYNALLAREREALGAAGIGVEAAYRARFGAAWQARDDDDMTRLYNFWAQPGAHDGFCIAARDVLGEAATVEPADFARFAAAALPRLEAPLVASFTAFDDYRARLAAWQARQTTQVIATSAPAAVTLAPVAVEPVALASRLGPDGS